MPRFFLFLPLALLLQWTRKTIPKKGEGARAPPFSSSLSPTRKGVYQKIQKIENIYQTIPHLPQTFPLINKILYGKEEHKSRGRRRGKYLGSTPHLSRGAGESIDRIYPKPFSPLLLRLCHHRTCVLERRIFFPQKEGNTGVHIPFPRGNLPPARRKKNIYDLAPSHYNIHLCHGGLPPPPHSCRPGSVLPRYADVMAP